MSKRADSCRGIGAQSNSSRKINDKELGNIPGTNAKRKKKKRKKQEEKQREKLTRSLHASRPGYTPPASANRVRPREAQSEIIVERAEGEVEREEVERAGTQPSPAHKSVLSLPRKGRARTAVRHSNTQTHPAPSSPGGSCATGRGPPCAHIHIQVGSRANCARCTHRDRRVAYGLSLRRAAGVANLAAVRIAGTGGEGEIHSHSTLTLFALYLTFGTLYNHLTLGLFRKYTRCSGARCITGGST
ncbi:hypothetical protein B0H14DRAFT_3447626 [Mycena olivaceomarginata]|nr:hypothetical protein B0H14DRAFT_3447626 [Mycena olivaceomarginata]